MGLLKTIFFIILFSYVFKFLARLFAPLLIKKAAETMKRKAQQQYRGNQQQYKSSVPEGETVIDTQPRNEQKSKSSVGEYVDFEEID
jgi:predicted membrane protein